MMAKMQMRRGQVVAWLVEEFDFTEHRVRVLLEERVISPMEKLYSRQKHNYYSRDQIVADVLRPMGLIEGELKQGTGI